MKTVLQVYKCILIINYIEIYLDFLKCVIHPIHFTGG